ncbi:MAG TPA: bifunctional indole-3-glycerol-phosphate synthase TrpC/phosphoribosylanthranilate isomerase TrpF [Myxococcota bacterium]|nr:bifunctional indole-3-glycerol-phosphate synthase TrpC/phosphoribosylanthranilate isomerase TrpF [Myxococcota bacterium]
MVLDLIVKHKQELMSSHKPLDNGFKAKLKPSSRSLKKALLSNRTSFICEIKPASPSQGVLRKEIDISEIANIYDPFADAISVLADEKFFNGSLENVRKVSEGTACPILCKDVVIGPEQIYEARYFGADAVLLMLSVLDDDNYKRCYEVAAGLNLDVISEVHDESEMKRAVKLKAPIIGINNRNLKTLEIDMDTTERLLPMAPKDAVLISESGFSDHAQVMRYKNKVNGFLVGSSLMRSSRIDLALRALIFGRVKICGITNANDARLAYDAGAYYGGLNFAPQSKRKIDIKEAKMIKAGAPLKWGGIFVDQSLDEVIQTANALNLDFVQLHGHEAKDFIQDLRPMLPVDCEIWKAFGMHESIEIPERLGADLLLFDAANNQGTGKSFNWKIIDQARTERFGIAGGIGAHNAHDAARLNPYLIDIASGAEEVDPRKKSKSSLQEIFKVLRG